MDACTGGPPLHPDTCAMLRRIADRVDAVRPDDAGIIAFWLSHPTLRVGVDAAHLAS